MKKFLIMLIAPCIALCLSACGENTSSTVERQTGESSAVITEQTPAHNAPQTSESSAVSTEQITSQNSETEMNNMQVNIQIGDLTFTAVLEDNAAAREFAEMLPLTVEMREYGGFEKVGSLGKNLTSSDRQTTTTAGDIVLYNSNQIVMFYGSNSWSYTRLGRVENLEGWEETLNGGNITAVFSL